MEAMSYGRVSTEEQVKEWVSFATQEARVLVSEAAVWDWLQLGTLKGVKVRRQWRIRECDLEAYLVEPESTRADTEASA
jgi:very-short-patch-repair endonuclease